MAFTKHQPFKVFVSVYFEHPRNLKNYLKNSNKTKFWWEITNQSSDFWQLSFSLCCQEFSHFWKRWNCPWTVLICQCVTSKVKKKKSSWTSIYQWAALEIYIYIYEIYIYIHTYIYRNGIEMIKRWCLRPAERKWGWEKDKIQKKNTWMNSWPVILFKCWFILRNLTTFRYGMDEHFFGAQFTI